MKHLISEEKGLKKHDYDQGAQKLEVFRIKDKLEHDRERQKKVVTRRQQLAFEKDLITEA